MKRRKIGLTSDHFSLISVEDLPSKNPVTQKNPAIVSVRAYVRMSSLPSPASSTADPSIRPESHIPRSNCIHSSELSPSHHGLLSLVPISANVDSLLAPRPLIEMSLSGRNAGWDLVDKDGSTIKSEVK